ncbi:diiron oxygenase [Pyxidicoccus trucidator]|uniref:diiron oxygenase n=1 Tax=Pyxidicoccus trucidator TaxID=2709662 RepID=UPI0013DCAD3A|nr:diiron oxygenase [Pyxidicoccus trucidator]
MTDGRALPGVDLTPDALAGPSLERLCELAARDQWRLEDLDWSSVDVSALPEPFRQTAADAFAQLQWGEQTALFAAMRLMELLPEGAARTFLATQRTDEARHVAFFERVVRLFGCEGRVRPSVLRLMQEVREAETPEALLLGMQVLIEGVAHSMFLEAVKLVEAMGDIEEFDSSIRALKTLVAESMPRLARDESRHIAFGLHSLRRLIPQLDGAARLRLEEKVALWGEWLLEQVRDPDLVVGIGMDGDALCGRLIEDLNLRIGQVGLATRLAPLRAEG